MNCIFCKIAEGAIPSHKIYENDNFFAFLDINPKAIGHTLVIPKKHIKWVWDAPNVGEYFEVAKKIALAQRKAFGVEMIVSKVVGDEVPHAHIHLMPDNKISGDKKNFKGNAEKIIGSL